MQGSTCPPNQRPRSSCSQLQGSPTAAAAAGTDRLLRATRAMQLGDWRAAQSLLTAEAEEAPQGWLAFDLRALCCLEMGRHPQALEDALRCTQLNPDWWVGCSGWGGGWPMGVGEEDDACLQGGRNATPCRAL